MGLNPWEFYICQHFVISSATHLACAIIKCALRWKALFNRRQYLAFIWFFLFACCWREKNTGCMKKLSFAKLSIWRSCCQFGRNTYDILSKSENAQIGKTQFFRHPVCSYILLLNKFLVGFNPWEFLSSICGQIDPNESYYVELRM